MRKLLILSFFLPLMAWGQSSLPPCPETGIMSNCFGSLTYANGNKYVGGFRDGAPYGEGIEYHPDGSVKESGSWQGFRLARPYALNLTQYRFGPPTQSEINFATSLGIPGLRSLPWKDRLDRVVQSELRNWLAPQNTGLDEIPTPSYPAALSLKQEPWETNKEFEDRVEKARTERRLAIDRLQAEYRAKVEERNKRVAALSMER